MLLPPLARLFGSAFLAAELLPTLAAAARDGGRMPVRVWSAVCASGEAVYGLRIAWELVAKEEFPEMAIAIIATDAEHTMLARLRPGCTD